MISRLLLVVVLLVPRLCFGQEGVKMDEAMQAFAQDGKFMGTVLVARGNQVVDAQAEFVKNEKGQVTQMILHQGGRAQVAKRL